MADTDFKEKVDDSSPGNAGFNMVGSKATWVYVRKNPTADDVLNFPSAILGQTSTQTQPNGNLARTPPIQHPCWPKLYASNIGSLAGFGRPVKAASNAEPEGGEIITGFALYPTYKISVDFINRPYPIASDGKIIKQTGSWYYEGNPVYANSLVPANPPVNFPYVNEWDRWTDLDHDPKEQALTAQQGTMAFQSTDSGINGQIFPGQPKMTLPNQLVRMVWYEVPYRYVISPNCYFSKWIGRLNQNDIKICGRTYKSGELLYLGWKPNKYNPPTPPLENQTDLTNPTDFYNYALCNLEFHFLYSPRTAKDVPPAPDLIVNPNFITAGHNLLPWVIDRQYHFALSRSPGGGSNVQSTPSFFSFPLEIMQYDPDAPDALKVSRYP